MKDINMRYIPKDAVYKDVVIVGNGPSGLALSYMLSGNWPYWNPEKIQKHPDELLRARLNYADSSNSLVVQNLRDLAEGIEGRSTNPVSLLLDSLEHPCADLGMELPSMLEYKSHPNAQVDHIVLGKGPPGGSWHRMDPNLRTLSLAAWMSLPGLSFSDWESRQLKLELTGKLNSKKPTKDQRVKSDENSTSLRKKAIENTTSISSCSKCQELRTKQKQIEQKTILVNNNETESGALCCKCTKALKNEQQLSSIVDNQQDITLTTGIPPRRNLSLKRQVSKDVQTRALVSRVAQYYEDYVRQMNLEKYFMNDTFVSMIAPIHDNVCTLGKFKAARWIVCGVNKLTGKTFCYVCKNVVLANGASDLANRLGLHGEDFNVSWVKHELPQLEAALDSFSDKERSQLKPVLIVGAGLSAADAVTICRSSDIQVIHVFRSRSAGLDKMLPENVYPEYHEVHRMMRDSNNVYDNYTPLPEHTISDLSGGTDGIHYVTVQNINTGETQRFEVSYCAILIGARPDLRFTSGIAKCAQKSVSCLETSREKYNISPEHISLLSRRISWFKNICAKCRHLNICDWNRRHEYGKICSHLQGKTCECNKLTQIEPEVKICPADGVGLGLDPTKPIDCKSNQIAVDKYTNEVIRAPKGLYAMGPLVGDNFVRFIPGGALAITASLYKEND